MSERHPPHAAGPSPLEMRRDALLLRIITLREKVKNTDFDTEIVSKELAELDTAVQSGRGDRDMKVFEDILGKLEEIVDSKR